MLVLAAQTANHHGATKAILACLIAVMVLIVVYGITQWKKS